MADFDIRCKGKRLVEVAVIFGIDHLLGEQCKTRTVQDVVELTLKVQKLQMAEEDLLAHRQSAWLKND